MQELRKIIIRLPQYIWHFGCLIFFRVIGFFALKLSDKYRDIWIVSERGDDARDNAYWFFKFLRETRPDIKAYYIIDKNSPDREKVARFGETVNHGSFMHHLLYAVSDYKISTHIFGYSPDILCYSKFAKLLKVRGKRVFLQHGITEKDVKWMFYPNTELDLFVCGAEPEYRGVKERYGYPEGVVKYLGFCRYDNLLKPHEIKRRILFMPTWRGDICNYTPAAFRKTEYFETLQSLINNKELIGYLESIGFELAFYPHYEVQKYIDLFSSDSAAVKILTFGNADVQELLMDSMMLITDYSSVAFDFAYMGKPMAYYQFDAEEFFAGHYGRGYFSYENDGFGPVIENEDELVSYIKKTAERSFVPEEKYTERTDKFFPARNDRNCERNLNAILNL